MGINLDQEDVRIPKWYPYLARVFRFAMYTFFTGYLILIFLCTIDLVSRILR